MITLLNHLFSDYNDEEVLNIFSLTNRRGNKNVVNTEGQDLNFSYNSAGNIGYSSQICMR